MSALSQVTWIDLPSVVDERGVLTVIESAQSIPFEIKRVFFMHHITQDRGGHAHMDTQEMVIAAHGSFFIEATDGERSETYLMDNPQRALFIPPMVFIRLYQFSPGAVCLALTDTHYDIKRSYRSWEAYLEAIGKTNPTI